MADVPRDPPTVTVNQPAASVLKPLHDVMRDITPDADNDGEMPTEERIALHEDRAAITSPCTTSRRGCGARPGTDAN